jgi:hypothetical protein
MCLLTFSSVSSPLSYLCLYLLPNNSLYSVDLTKGGYACYGYVLPHFHVRGALPYLKAA